MISQKTQGKLVLFLTVTCCLLLLAVVFAFAEQGAGYVGSDQCKDCHENVTTSFPKSMHAKAWAAKGGGYGCESCHGPASAHLENPSRKTIISFGKKSLQNTDVQSGQCLGCHSATTALMYWDSGMHKKKDVSCSSCHSIHAGRSPVAKQPETCFTCHRDIRYQANKQSHHPIIEGKIKCSDCHNPHGAPTHGMIKADTANLLCYKCHADKRGPFLWEHPPVEEDCLKCHETHGTKASKLLKEKVPNLCQDCHDAQRHPGNPYDARSGFNGPATATAPFVTSRSNKFYARSCLNCHGVIHGSYAPENPADVRNSGRYFLR